MSASTADPPSDNQVYIYRHSLCFLYCLQVGFLIFKSSSDIVDVISRQMEAANRLDEIRDTLNLSETDPIPQIVLDG
jgi:hypothetical protein